MDPHQAAVCGDYLQGRNEYRHTDAGPYSAVCGNVYADDGILYAVFRQFCIPAGDGTAGRTGFIYREARVAAVSGNIAPAGFCVSAAGTDSRRHYDRNRMAAGGTAGGHSSGGRVCLLPGLRMSADLQFISVAVYLKLLDRFGGRYLGYQQCAVGFQ